MRIAVLFLLCLLCGCGEEPPVSALRLPPDQSVTSASVSINRLDAQHGGTWFINVTAQISAESRADALKKIATILRAHAAASLNVNEESKTLKAEADSPDHKWLPD